ncbi:unnamed protein product [Diatraea saccharalis]|uniref:Uncharacterized protein n=1 Tax=Diatraea saccharalis TaxID=40085 RepID=A0A9N9WLK5_9NEOP|nr:unnamed protein product [Diatraea saccharalis]
MMYIAGFIVALVLAALVVIWIAYCMFVRERHKSEFYQYNISDLQHREFEQPPQNEKVMEKKEITAGIFILPSRRKQKDDYVKRPDYPESPTHQMDTGTDKLIEIFNENTADIHFRDGIMDDETNVCSNAAYHSDV